jgi:anti-anti-sigma factor
LSLPPLPRAGALLIDVDVAAGRLTVTGRLDSHTVRALHSAVSDLLLTEQRRWVLDVAAVTVTDHTGLRAIGAAYRRLLRHDRRLTLSGASPDLERVLTRLRLGRHLLEERVPA